MLWRAVIHVLFVGNSLTYFNDLPALVSEIARLDGVTIESKEIVLPNFSLEDHLANPSIPQALSDRHFDYLVAQQGPSASRESQASLKKSAMDIAKLCRSRNTKFGLYMVWPEMARDAYRDDCIASYTNAAKESGALLFPAGVAWKYVLEKDPKFPLYGPDQFHPGIHGSVLAAMVIYAKLNNKTDLDFLKGSRWKEISDDQLDVMKSAALRSLTFP